MLRVLAPLLFLPLLFALATGAACAAPPERSAACEVTVHGASVPVYDTAVTHYHTFTSRPMSETTPVALATAKGSAEIAVRFAGVPLESVTVRPLALGITAQIAGDTARFTAAAPAQITLEYNGQVKGALHLFLTEPDTDKPDAEAADVLYFGPGVHEAGIIIPKSGQTVYLDEGAIVRGAIHAEGVEGVRVAGHGLIDGSAFDRWKDALVPIDFRHASGVTIEGITILNPAAWTLNLYQSRDIIISGVNIIGARANSDGITIQSCENVAVSGCFVRGWDDNLVVKGYDADARDIIFENCVLWTDLAQSCEVGYETRADVIERITFRNITVLHNFHKPVMSVHNSDSALVRDVLFQNITVEDAQMGQGDGTNLLVELTTTKSQWSKTKRRGNIRGVMFDAISVLGGKESSIRIFSQGKDANIDDVTFRNLTILGERITDFSQLRMNINRHNGSNIVLKAD
ncbi:MAG: hypothetical protein LBU67_03805 [Oscillospiraceae bacterium]|nr:hypothetical protein [Oscillospiraceae bacterium]